MADTVKIDGTEYELDDFELGELEWLEDHLGKPITDFSVLSSMKAAVGLVYLVKKRENPAFTIDEARRMKITSVFQAPEEADQASAEGKRPPKRAAR